MSEEYQIKGDKKAPNAIIKDKKWFASQGEQYIYTFFERTMCTRDKKDALVKELKKKKLDPIVLSRDISYKSKNEKTACYLIAISYNKFLNTYNISKVIPTKLTLKVPEKELEPLIN